MHKEATYSSHRKLFEHRPARFSLWRRNTWRNPRWLVVKASRGRRSMKLLIFYKSRSGSTWCILYTIFLSEELYWRREVEKGREKRVSGDTRWRQRWERRVDTKWRECVFSWINNVIVGSRGSVFKERWAVCIYGTIPWTSKVWS